MHHLMIDIETLGTTPNAPIVQIGAVFFNPGTYKLGESLDLRINLKTAMQGRTVDPGTLQFWLTQSEKAREAMAQPQGTSNLQYALIALAGLIRNNHDPDNYLRVWTNGPSFDQAILEDAYRQYNMDIPWPYAAGRDVRTICELAKPAMDRKSFTFYGEPHRALDDAKHQAIFVSYMWQYLGESRGLKPTKADGGRREPTK